MAIVLVEVCFFSLPVNCWCLTLLLTVDLVRTTEWRPIERRRQDTEECQLKCYGGALLCCFIFTQKTVFWPPFPLWTLLSSLCGDDFAAAAAVANWPCLIFAVTLFSLILAHYLPSVNFVGYCLLLFASSRTIEQHPFASLLISSRHCTVLLLLHFLQHLSGILILAENLSIALRQYWVMLPFGLQQELYY